MKRTPCLIAATALLATAVACGDNPPSPVGPSATIAPEAEAGAAPDGSTLKVPAPAHVSPANGVTLEEFEVTLRVNPVTAKFTDEDQFAYRFELLLNGRAVRNVRTTTTRWVLDLSNLEVDTTYSWRARAEKAGFVGPWSEPWSFRTPEIPQGYNIPGELYDPLYTGKTVGNPNGAVTFVPGVGARLEGHTSHIEYVLPETIRNGEFSMLVTNVPANTEGGKTKIMSMSEGRSDITTNDRRFTIEKRGDPPGIIAWRMITHDSQIDTVGQERVSRDFKANLTYLWKATFRNGRFQLEIFEGGAGGKRIYGFGKPYDGAYDPNPHLAYVGAPVGRGGPSDATVPGMVARQVWLSSRPRPDFANR